MTTLFGISIHEAQFNNLDLLDSVVESIKTLLNHKEASLHELAKSNSLSSYHYMSNIDLPDELTNFVSEQAGIYWKNLGYSKLLKPYILQKWANCTEPGGSWETHNHSPAPLSGVLYLTSSDTMGNIVFENPLSLVLACQPYEFDFKYKKFEHEIENKKGKLLLFPGYLLHHTQPNQDTQYRYAIGFNIGCQGEVRYCQYI